jgi:hypothetical protein
LGVDGEVTVPNSGTFCFASLPERVATPARVVLGDVEDHAEVRITQRLLRDRVEKILAGRRAGPSVVISTMGWRRLRMEGYPWVRGGAALDAGHTHDPLTRQLAELRLTELERQIGTATAAIRRGEVRRKSHHSRWLGTNFRATPESSCQDVPLGSSWAHLSRLMATGDRVDDRGGAPLSYSRRFSD